MKIVKWKIGKNPNNAQKHLLPYTGWGARGRRLDGWGIKLLELHKQKGDLLVKIPSLFTSSPEHPLRNDAFSLN